MKEIDEVRIIKMKTINNNKYGIKNRSEKNGYLSTDKKIRQKHDG